MKSINSTVATIEESIFSQMTSLANEYEAINLSQGFPNFEGPTFIRESLSEAISIKALGQYAPMPGIPALLESLQGHFQKRYDLKYDASQITVTNGATEAIMVGSLALLEEGDEVILFEPFYDSYPVAARLAGAKVKVVTLKGPDFKWDENELRKAFSPKTKLVYLNNPHNPTGRVFTKEELEGLAKLIKEFDAYVLSDEVYEFLTFDEHIHYPMASIAGMKERTLTIGSAGKTFGHTGLKVGWLASSPQLTKAIRMVHQFNVFSVNPMAQYAVARGLEQMDSYQPKFQKLYQEKRDILRSHLLSAGFKPCPTQGTYFTLVPIPEDKLTEGHDDLSFCRHLIKTKKVATIPPSAFYEKSNEGSKYLRFCFAKTNETLDQAGVYLKSEA
jgi:N-succinyldiaminopimelate aminotransferase